MFLDAMAIGLWIGYWVWIMMMVGTGISWMKRYNLFLEELDER